MDSENDGNGKRSALDTTAGGEGKGASSLSNQSVAVERSVNGQPSVPATPADAKGKGAGSLFCKPVSGSHNPPSRHVLPFSIDVGDDGQWEVYGKKSSRQISFAASIQQKGAPAASSLKARQDTPRKGPVDWKRNAGGGNVKPLPPAQAWESLYMGPPPVVPPPLPHGWQWASRADSSNKVPSQGNVSESENVQNENYMASRFPQQGVGSGSETAGQLPDQVSEEEDDDYELLDDSDGDPLSDDYDSDVTLKSHETRKNSKWLKGFFEVLDKLTVEEINDASRQWHCPACHDGPGAIDWYKGLQPLMAHAKTKGARRVKLHRELAELLDEELQRRGTSVIPSGEAFGKWKGLREATPDHLIVWPPMVIVMNTLLEKDENEKWVGMGNQELVEYFNKYDAVKARQSYGPHGHRGIGVLIFEATAMGYMEAERLHKDFIKQGTDREAWESRRVLFYPGGKRQLYGFMACKEDMDNFNLHSQGKSKLKVEMRSYQETVVSQLKQISEDNQRLNYLENKVAKQKSLANTMGVICEKLRFANLENRIVRQRSKAHYEENKEEMDNMECFFKEKMDAIHKSLEQKETAFEKLLQNDRERAQQSTISFGSRTERNLRLEEIARFIDSQTKGVEEFEAEREKLIKIHEEKKTELRRRYLEEEVELEKEFDAGLTQLMEKYQAHSLELSK